MDLSWLEKRLRKDQKLLKDKVKSMAGTLNTTLESVERIITELRPGLLDDLGLAAAIEWQAGDFQRRTGIECKISMDPEEILFDKELSTAIFRIFQETLTNIIRHAKAKLVKVVIEFRNHHFLIRISDNGIGIPKEKLSDIESFGIMGMKERIAFCNGNMDIKTEAGKGTEIQIKIPIREVS